MLTNSFSSVRKKIAIFESINDESQSNNNEKITLKEKQIIKDLIDENNKDKNLEQLSIDQLQRTNIDNILTENIDKINEENKKKNFFDESNNINQIDLKKEKNKSYYTIINKKNKTPLTDRSESDDFEFTQKKSGEYFIITKENNDIEQSMSIDCLLENKNDKMSQKFIDYKNNNTEQFNYIKQENNNYSENIKNFNQYNKTDVKFENTNKNLKNQLIENFNEIDFNKEINIKKKEEHIKNNKNNNLNIVFCESENSILSDQNFTSKNENDAHNKYHSLLVEDVITITPNIIDSIKKSQNHNKFNYEKISKINNVNKHDCNLYEKKLEIVDKPELNNIKNNLNQNNLEIEKNIFVSIQSKCNDIKNILNSEQEIEEIISNIIQNLQTNNEINTDNQLSQSSLKKYKQFDEKINIKQNDIIKSVTDSPIGNVEEVLHNANTLSSLSFKENKNHDKVADVKNLIKSNNQSKEEGSLKELKQLEKEIDIKQNNIIKSVGSSPIKNVEDFLNEEILYGISTNTGSISSLTEFENLEREILHISSINNDQFITKDVMILSDICEEPEEIDEMKGLKKSTFEYIRNDNNDSNKLLIQKNQNNIKKLLEESEEESYINNDALQDVMLCSADSLELGLKSDHIIMNTSIDSLEPSYCIEETIKINSQNINKNDDDSLTESHTTPTAEEMVN